MVNASKTDVSLCTTRNTLYHFIPSVFVQFFVRLQYLIGACLIEYVLFVSIYLFALFQGLDISVAINQIGLYFYLRVRWVHVHIYLYVIETKVIVQTKIIHSKQFEYWAHIFYIIDFPYGRRDLGGDWILSWILHVQLHIIYENLLILFVKIW